MNMPPITLLLIILLCMMIITLPKKLLITAYVYGMCFVPADKSIVIATFNFYTLQILVTITMLRLIVNDELTYFKFNAIDKLFFAWQLSGTIIYILASQNHANAVIFKLGRMYMEIGLFLTFRQIITSREQIDLFVKHLGIACIILVPFSALEFITAKNPFAFLGRISISVREGKVRAATTFSHPILFGSFAAATFPLFWCKLKETHKNKTFWLATTISAVLLMLFSNSSGPLIAFLMIIPCIYIFRYRYSYKKILIGLAVSIISLHLFLELKDGSPIWSIYARLGSITGSTGWHRYLLVDSAVKEFGNWFMLGYGDRGPDWHIKYWPHTHATFTDVTNQYIYEAVRGGLLTLVFFLLLCKKIISSTGKFMFIKLDNSCQYFYWGIICSIFTHYISFTSVTYFGQITMLLLISIAISAKLEDENSLI